MTQSERIDFFRRHIGRLIGGKPSHAETFAQMEQWGEELGWTVTWEQDTDDDPDRPLCLLCHRGTCPGHDWYRATLRDSQGKAIRSLSGVEEASPVIRRLIAAWLVAGAVGDFAGEYLES